MTWSWALYGECSGSISVVQRQRKRVFENLPVGEKKLPQCISVALFLNVIKKQKDNARVQACSVTIYLIFCFCAPSCLLKLLSCSHKPAVRHFRRQGSFYHLVMVIKYLQGFIDQCQMPSSDAQIYGFYKAAFQKIMLVMFCIFIILDKCCLCSAAAQYIVSMSILQCACGQ